LTDYPTSSGVTRRASTDERSLPATRPRLVLLEAAVEEVRPIVEKLRAAGWPTEIVAVNEPEFFGVRVEIRLDGIPVPVEAARR
jgi:hypothetical protein